MGKIKVETNIPSLILQVFDGNSNCVEKQGKSSVICYFDKIDSSITEIIEVEVKKGIYEVRLCLPYFNTLNEAVGTLFKMPVVMDKICIVETDDTEINLEFKGVITKK